MVRVALSHHCWLDRGIYCLHLAFALRVADQGGNVRICESGRCCLSRIFRGRREHRPADAVWQRAGPGERDYDLDHAEECGQGECRVGGGKGGVSLCLSGRRKRTSRYALRNAYYYAILTHGRRLSGQA